MRTLEGFVEEADLVIKSARLVNVATGEVYEASIAISSGRVVDVGCVDDLIGSGTEVVEAHGLYAAPGFIDGHVHLESTHLTLASFAEVAIPHGTTSAVFDPHELANVAGRVGVEALMREADALPFGSYFTTPSCVPSAPGLETSGAELRASEVERLLRRPRVVGLAEVMDFPGVLRRHPLVTRKIEAALKLGKRVDGHCPRLTGRALASYIAAGPSSDHESSSGEEALEKLRLGLWVMVREGSVARNLEELLRAVVKEGLDVSRLMLVTDDLDPRDLASGYFEPRLRRAVELGVEPIDAVRLVTLNPSTYFRLDHEVGLVAPGRRADVVLLQDLTSFKPIYVVLKGKLTARGGVLLRECPKLEYPKRLRRSVKVAKPSPLDFAIKVDIKEGCVEARVIELREGSLITEERRATLRVINGLVHPSPDIDVVQVAVVERHGKSGNIGLGFASGLGLREGAVASTYSHDSHNIVVAGASWSDMAKAVERLRRLQGGFAVALRGSIIAELRLEVAGLMTHAPPAEVAKALEEVEDALHDLGCRLKRPMQALSFISLPAIPKLKLTDKGLVDVEMGRLVSPVLKDED